MLPAILSQMLFATASGLLGESKQADLSVPVYYIVMVLTIPSWKAGLLPTMEHRKRCSDGDRDWLIIHSSS